MINPSVEQLSKSVKITQSATHIDEKPWSFLPKCRQWYPSRKTCSTCSHVLEALKLSVRQWRCPSRQTVNDRDDNAATIIKTVGASTVGRGGVIQVQPATAV